MRGHMSSERIVLSAAIGPEAEAADRLRLLDAAPVREDLPIGAAELDAIEAFLMPQILAILNATDDTQREDSKPPQKPGKVPALSEVPP
jgi:hypothetical protein